MDVSGLPQVAILPEKFIKGATNLSDSVEGLPSVDFLTAFRTQYATDAHFVTYRVTGQQTFPRLNKPILSHIRALNAKGAPATIDVVTTMIVVEHDRPNHESWKPGEPAQFLSNLMTLAQRWPLAMKWTLFYTTRGGCRLVYVLDQPIPVDTVEGKILGLASAFCSQGVPMDIKVFDWTRAWRLPFVTRDGKQTWLTDPSLSEYIEQLDNRISANELPTVAVDSQVSTYADIKPFTDPKPQDEIAKALMEAVADNGRFKMTEWAKQAKAALKNRECWDCIYDHAPLAAIGKRGSTLLRYVGQAVSLLFYLEGTTAAHIYALFLDVALQLDPAPDVADWTDELWRFVGQTWAREEAKHQAVEKVAQERAEEAATLAERMLIGMRSWCRHPALWAKELGIAAAFLERHLLVSCGSTFFVMNEDGQYDPTPVKAEQLIAMIRAKHLDGVIETRQQSREGFYTDRPAQAIVNQYATVVNEIWAVPNLDTTEIENIDSPGATLRLPAFARNHELKPQFDPDIDLWLRSFFGANYELGIKWIAYALAFEDGPICALSIAGAAGAGKKMLVQGLAECLRTPRLATARDMVSDYGYGLLQSPFLIVNEGWPKVSGGMHPADQFRSLVSGDPLTINRKFMAPVNIINPVRCVFTANNLDVIRLLTRNRELSPEDREALAVRLLHFDIGDEASVHLLERGGMAHTGRAGRRWIRSDGGAPSDFIVARHFLYLHSIREKLGAAGGRFLVEGNAHQEILFEMRTQSGVSAVVIEAIVRMLELRRQFNGLAIVENRLFAVAADVLEFYRQNMTRSGSGEKVSANSITNVFRGVSLRDFKDAFILKTKEHMGRRRWHELDAAMLLEVARRDGWPCRVLEDLVSAQDMAKQVGTFTQALTAVQANVKLAADIRERVIMQNEPVSDKLRYGYEVVRRTA